MNIALIVAGGTGVRMNNETPKQFILVNEKPIIAYTLLQFNKIEEIDEIFVVANLVYVDLIKSIAKQYNITKLKDVIESGESRQLSVLSGITYLRNNNYSDNDNILIHDAVRPLVSERIIIDNINMCNKFNAVGTYLNCTDSVMKISENLEVLNRKEIFFAQTPQTFKLNVIYNAHSYALYNKINATDDCSLVNLLGEQIYIVNGEKKNIKITTPDDIKIFECFLKE